jgi:hypothetical protein
MWKTVLAFLDDVMVLGKDFQDHMDRVREVLDRFRAHKLKLKPKKCCLFRTKAKFLGKIVTGDSVSVDPETFETVKKWSEPRCTRDVESFLGFVNYNREHLPKLAEIAAPLYGLTGKAPFTWTEEHHNAFEQLKALLLSARVLGLPRSEGVFILDTDASNVAVGAQLSQMQDGVERPIAFTSKSLTPAQRKYCTTRKELLALVTFVRQYRHYLLGRQFLVRTDHSSLAWLMSFKNPEGQLARWLEELAQYNMSVMHRKGSEHANADALSRIPDELEYCDCYKAGADVTKLPCGGCSYCTRAQNQWRDFETDVDDVTNLSFPAVRLCSQPSNWAEILEPQKRSDVQDRDDDVKLVKKWLRDGHMPVTEELAAQSPTVKTLWANRQQLRLQGDVLVYHWVDETENRDLFVVPYGMRDMIQRLAHDNTLSGHYGMDHTLQRVRRYFFWPGMRKDIEDHVRACSACNRSKHLRRKYRAPLQEFTTGAPMEKVHMDIMGPFPLSTKGNRYLLVIVDQFTKWIEAVALPDQTAEMVAKATVDNFFS